MSVKTQDITAEQLLRMPEDIRCELIAGEIVYMAPAGPRHGLISLRIGSILLRHVMQHRLGEVYSNDTGFILARRPDTVRAPDIAFVRTDRVQNIEHGYYEGPPDLAVEVVSPDDRGKDVDDKVAMWLEQGAPMVWVVYPKTRSVAVHEPARDAVIFHENDTITGGDVVTGFNCRVRAFFE